MSIKHRIILQLFTIFIFYANNSTKSRKSNDVERKERFNSQKGPESINTLQANCPAIPKCQWARFEEMKLKVQQGAQSSVSILLDHFNMEPVVKKIFTDKQDFINEMKALSCLRVGHNRLLVYPLCVDPMNMTMVLEWGGEGDLTRWDLFRDETVKYSYSDVVRMSAQIVASVAAAHRRGYLHGDIKPENFVVNLKEKATKLIDFGLSTRLYQIRLMTQGTPQTMAPEVAFTDFFRNRLKRGPHARISEELMRSVSERPQVIKESMDWWSVGVTIHYLFYKFHEYEARRSPEKYTDSDSESGSSSDSMIMFEGDSDDHYFPYKIIWSEDNRDILNFEYRPTPKFFSPELRNFLNKLMAWNPEKRNFNRKKLEQEVLRDEFFEEIDWNEIDPNLPK